MVEVVITVIAVRIETIISIGISSSVSSVRGVRCVSVIKTIVIAVVKAIVETVVVQVRVVIGWCQSGLGLLFEGGGNWGSERGG